MCSVYTPNIKTPLIHFRVYVSFFRGVLIGLFLDGVWISNQVNPYMSPFLWQLLISMIAIHRFYTVFKRASKRVKSFMKYAIFVGLFLEVGASSILQMYTYRLENIPLYVPFGHALIYLCAFYLSQEPYLKKRKEKITDFLFLGTFVYSFLWAYFDNDLFGLFCFAIFLVVYYLNKRSRFFMLIIFYLVIYVELIGTATGAWSWAEVTLIGLPSSNPPSAVGVAYMFLDFLCLSLYKYFHPQIWKRFKSIYR